MATEVSIHGVTKTVADPGFPTGGAPTHWGGANLQCVHFLAKMYAKTKEIDPVGGAPAAPPESANGRLINIVTYVL